MDLFWHCEIFPDAHAHRDIARRLTSDRPVLLKGSRRSNAKLPSVNGSAAGGKAESEREGIEQAEEAVRIRN